MVIRSLLGIRFLYNVFLYFATFFCCVVSMCIGMNECSTWVFNICYHFCMDTPIYLPSGVALFIIAFLLALLPAGLFIWLWYLRRRDQATPAKAVALAFVLGLVSVWPAFALEDFSHLAWDTFSPSTSHYFYGAVLPIERLIDLLLPALGTFLVVATVEEGVRYIALLTWVRRSKVIDQVFDGLLLGVAMGLGFATFENATYFLNLFEQANYDTLVFVFFLRFVLSTLAHVSFGGIMGAMIARGVFHVYDPRRFLLPAFMIPWFLHGLYDLLLGVGLGFYAVLVLVPAVIVVSRWTMRRDFFVVNRKNGELLAVEEAPSVSDGGQVSQGQGAVNSSWNRYAPWMNSGASSKNKSNDA